MYLHFEDWTQPFILHQIEKNGLPHGGRIIKVFASASSQKERFQKQQLFEIESSHAPFSHEEVFQYEGGRTFTGDQLEDELNRRNVKEVNKEMVRALFRFANREDAGFTQAAMSTMRDGLWLFNHPFDDIDGMDRDNIHLDIFFPESLLRLKKIVDYENPDLVISAMEGARIKRREAL